ncbi:MAG: alpha/beta fold hydrolase [Pseudomonadota bacterium]
MDRLPLLFLPGMMCDARLFAPQIATFSKDHPVLLAPLVGRSTVTDLATDILAWAPERFALAGLSFGGIVAMEMVRQAPDRVSRLALLDTNPLAEPPEKAAIRDQQITRVLAGQLRAVMRDEMKPNYLAPGPENERVLNLCMDMAESLGNDVFVSQSRALQSRRDQRETLKQVSHPTLVVCGEHDTLCPLQRHELMRDLIAGAELSVIPGAGHLPTLEQPERTSAALAAWLAR